MKKKLLIVIITLILLTLSFSGCFDNKKSSSDAELDRFIGTWYGWAIFESWRATWKLYENGSIKILDTFGENWGTYRLDGTELEIKIPNPTEEHPDAARTTWYDYEFSHNDTFLTLFVPFGDDEGELYGEFYKDSYRGEQYQKISKFFGTWSNSTYWENFGDCPNWIMYTNYTFYSNYSVKEESNWCSSGVTVWNAEWHSYYFDENDWLCISTGCSEYNFSEDNTILLYNGNEYKKVE